MSKQKSNTQTTTKNKAGQKREAALTQLVRHSALREMVGTRKSSSEYRSTGECARPPKLMTARQNLLTSALDSAMYKTINIELTAGSVSWNGLLFSTLGSIVAGDADGQRVGDMIDVRHVDLRWEAAYGSVNTAACRTGFRVILFRSAIPNLGVADILRTTGSAYAACSPLNEDFMRASEVLYDTFRNMDEYHPYHVGHHERKLSMPVLYEGASGLAFGNLYVLMVSGEDPAQATYVPAGFGYIQIKYVDV